MVRKGWTRNVMALLLPFIMFSAFLMFLRSTSSLMGNTGDLPKELFPQEDAVKKYRIPNRIKISNSVHSPNFECVNIEVNEVSSSRKIHRYDDEAHLRLIILTYNRFKSLKKVLESLQGLVLDGHNATMEIWVDRTKDNQLDGDTYRTARSFCWDKGPVYVHIHSEHVGIYGQWIHTWKPQSRGSLAIDELAIFIEDDVDISKYAYRWLRRAHLFYGEEEDMSGYSLQDENLKYASGKEKGKEVPKTGKGLVYMFPVAGSWGFAPHPKRWLEFQEWYLRKSQDNNFKPYVPDAPLHTEWYRTFEKDRKADTMWTIWYIRFCFERSLYSLYSNIPTYFNITEGSLVSNRKEAGLHYIEKKRHMYAVPKLLQNWKETLVDFPPYAQVKRFDYNGKELGKHIKLGG